VELCQHFLILARRIIAPIHLEEVGGGVDVGCGVFVALGDDPAIRVNAFEYDANRWQRSSSCHGSGGMAKSDTTCVPSSMSYVLYHTSLTLIVCIAGGVFPYPLTCGGRVDLPSLSSLAWRRRHAGVLDSHLAAQAALLSRYPRGVAIH
jgi:hypothetical protein